MIHLLIKPKTKTNELTTAHPLPLSPLFPAHHGCLVTIALATTPAQRAALPVRLPSTPDAITVFSERDYVSLEGYPLQIGRPALVEVFRAGLLVGQTLGRGSTTGNFLDVNHAGGEATRDETTEIVQCIIDCTSPHEQHRNDRILSTTTTTFIILFNHNNTSSSLVVTRVLGWCWGANAIFAFTPDIVAGDTVMVTFEDGSYNSVIVPDAKATSYTLADSTITVGGTIGALVSRVNFEALILNPG